MSNIEASSISKPHENANASAGVGDVIGEFASSAWKGGVVRPLSGVAQLAGADVRVEPEQNLSGAMRAAHIAGSAVGTLTDLVVLSKVVGNGVGALGEAAGIKSLMAENSLARTLTASGTTGFIDGFALNPTQPGDGNRFLHGLAEGAGFMALGGSARLLGGLPEGAITNKVSRLGEKVANTFSENAPAWASDAGRSAADFLGRNAQKAGDLITSRFPSLTAENMTRNAIAGFLGGDVYYATDTTLNGKQPSLLDGESTALGWALGNAFLGGKLGMARPSEVRVEAKPEPPAPEAASDVETRTEAPPPPSYKPEFKTLENGDQQWTYKDVPSVGDETTYTKSRLDNDSVSPRLDWQIKTADGRVYDRNTKGPWEVNYPDGSSLQKNEYNYLSFSKPITVEIGGTPLAVKEVTQLEADQKAIAKQWVYEDPAVPNQTVTFNADRTWEAVGADGKGFSYRSPGPWKVTNLDGYVETLPAGSTSKDVEIEHIAGHSNWRDFVGSQEHNAEPGSSRRPQAFLLSASDTSPMSLSAIPRTMDISSVQQEAF